MINVILGSALLLSFHIALAADNIYIKTQDNEFQGILLEQNFEQRYYKMQLLDQSIITIAFSDIIKLRQTAQQASTQHASTTHSINTNRLKSWQYRPKIQAYLGTLEHKLTLDDGRKKDSGNFAGLSLAVQYNTNDHLSLYGELNTGRSRSYTFNYDGNHYDRNGESYGSLQLAGVLNTNLYTGFNAITGLGIMVERYDTHEQEDTVPSVTGQLGVSYRWRGLLIAFRYQYLFSDRYNDEIKQVTNKNLQIGLAFN